MIRQSIGKKAVETLGSDPEDSKIALKVPKGSTSHSSRKGWSTSSKLLGGVDYD